MDLELTGRRAVVTGGSRGIGLAVGRALAAEGADVALVARGKDALDAAVAQVAQVAQRARESGRAREGGGRVIGIAADTGDDASVAALAEEVVAQFGGVDILVNAAATPNPGGFDESELEAQFNVKVRGYLRTARAFAPLMTAQGWGRIVNISGLAARHTGSVVGSVRNAAVAALTKNLADELGPQGVNVTVVHPGLTRTEATEGNFAARAERLGVSPAEVEATAAAGISIGRLVTAAEVADVVAFLASPRGAALNGDPVLASGGVPGPIHY